MSFSFSFSSDQILIRKAQLEIDKIWKKNCWPKYFFVKYSNHMSGIQMVYLCPVVKWSGIQMVVWKSDWKNYVSGPKCSAKSRDFNIWIPDTHTVQYSGVWYSYGHWNVLHLQRIQFSSRHFIFYPHLMKDIYWNNTHDYCYNTQFS